MAQLQCNDNTAALMASYIVQGNVTQQCLNGSYLSYVGQYLIQGPVFSLIYETYLKGEKTRMTSTAASSVLHWLELCM